MLLNAILETKLRHDPARSSGDWRVWEHKTLNIHRGVLCWRPAEEPATYGGVSAAVRAKVAECFKRSWWRGFGFGVVVELDRMPAGIEAADDDVDTRDNRKGTWQWSVLAFRQPQVALGVHTWTHGYLTDVYAGLLAHYQSQGYQTGIFKKEKDALMRFLTAVSGLGLPEHDAR